MWLSKVRVSNVYDDVELPWPDTKVACMLCLGGLCKYKVKSDSNVNCQFILDYVAPYAKSRVGDNVAYVIRTALLFYVFSDRQATDPVPPNLETRVCNAYE